MARDKKPVKIKRTFVERASDRLGQLKARVGRERAALGEATGGGSERAGAKVRQRLSSAGAKLRGVGTNLADFGRAALGKPTSQPVRKIVLPGEAEPPTQQTRGGAAGSRASRRR